MPATRSMIERWLEEGREKGATHVAVRCDTFDWTGEPGDDCDYPVFIMPKDGKALAEQSVHFEAVGSGGDRLLEVYSLTGKHTIDEQMAERRAFHYD